MDIRKCVLDDIQAVNSLMDQVGFGHIHEKMIDDVSIGAFDGVECLGFIWGGITESGWLCYMDYMAVKPGTSGIGTRLVQEMSKYLESTDVRTIMTFVKYSGTIDEEKSLILNAKMGMYPLSKPYHFCIGNLERDRSWAL